MNLGLRKKCIPPRRLYNSIVQKLYVVIASAGVVAAFVAAADWIIVT